MWISLVILGEIQRNYVFKNWNFVNELQSSVWCFHIFYPLRNFKQSRWISFSTKINTIIGKFSRHIFIQNVCLAAYLNISFKRPPVIFISDCIMFEFVMIPECCMLFKCISTHGTLVWTLIRVDSLVSSKNLKTILIIRCVNLTIKAHPVEMHSAKIYMYWIKPPIWQTVVTQSVVLTNRDC